MAHCTTCELIARRDAGNAPPWDSIARTPAWDVVHAFGTSLPGWTVLVVRRHLTAVAELTDEEAAELGPLIRAVSRGLHEVVGCAKTYVAQFAEAVDHPHVHVHVIPRHVDQPDELKGPAVFAALGVPAEQCVPEPTMNDIAARMRPYLTS